MLFRKKEHIKNLPDEELIAHYQQHEDQKYIAILFERYVDIVFAASMKYLKNEDESEDITMQLFEKLIDNLLTYKINNFSYWLSVVVKNHCLAYLKKKNRYREKKQEYYQELPNEHQVFYLKTEQDTLELQLEGLEVAIAKLKDPQRICIELFYLQQLSYREIVQQTGFTFKQVKSYIQNGKRNLKLFLTKDKQDVSS